MLFLLSKCASKASMPVRLDHHGHGSPLPQKTASQFFRSSLTLGLVKPPTAEKIFIIFFALLYTGLHSFATVVGIVLKCNTLFLQSKLIDQYVILSTSRVCGCIGFPQSQHVWSRHRSHYGNYLTVTSVGFNVCAV